MSHEKLSRPARETILSEAPVLQASIGRILEALNDREDECPHCHLHVKRCYRDHQLAENLRSFRTKIGRWAKEAGVRS